MLYYSLNLCVVKSNTAVSFGVLNDILRIILSCNVCTPVSHLYCSLKFLKLEDIYELELSKFMHQLHNNKPPDIFCEYFPKEVLYRGIKLRSKFNNSIISTH